MKQLFVSLLLVFAILAGSATALAQADAAGKKSKSTEKTAKATTAKEATKSTAKAADAQNPDPVVGKTTDGKAVYEGSRGGFYYMTDKGDKAYVKDFVGAKIVGKTDDGKNIYEGPKGGKFYYKDDGTKIYVKNKK
jgi:colicin import membrane protein